MKLYLDMLNISTIPNSWQCTSGDIMRLSGINLGNFAFRHALYSLLGELADFRPVTYSDYDAATKEQAPEHVIVSCANWLGTSEADERNNGYRAKVLERARKVTVFGLGGQAPAGTTTLTLGPNTERMVRVIAARGPSLSVRDDLTAATLKALGIEAVVTGCPSNFINGAPDLGAQIMARAEARQSQAPGWDVLRCFISEASSGHDHTNAVVASQLRLMAAHRVAYVLQTPALLPMLLGESTVVPPLYTDNSDLDAQALRGVLMQSMQHFSSVDGWMDFARTCHLAFGMRIHGTMLPLQAGVPSLLIQHDSRTAGLAQHMGIPAVSPEEYIALQEAGPAAFFERIARGTEGYDVRRGALAMVMQDYITAHGLAPHDSIIGLSSAV